MLLASKARQQQQHWRHFVCVCVGLLCEQQQQSVVIREEGEGRLCVWIIDRIDIERSVNKRQLPEPAAAEVFLYNTVTIRLRDKNDIALTPPLVQHVWKRLSIIAPTHPTIHPSLPLYKYLILWFCWFRLPAEIKRARECCVLCLVLLQQHTKAAAASFPTSRTSAHVPRFRPPKQHTNNTTAATQNLINTMNENGTMNMETDKIADDTTNSVTQVMVTNGL